MRTVRIELMKPIDILKEKEKCPIVYLPIGPLEWHGPHLPLGTDPLNAEAVSRLVAEEVGGVVIPTLYWGTERERSTEALKNIGFNGDEWVIGMDFPKNPMKSFYFSEDAFGMAVREYLRILVKQGYKLIVIINGHGARNHINVLTRLSIEFSRETSSKVIYSTTTFLDEEGNQDFGHAGKVETSILKYLQPESVDLHQLPPKGEKIYNLDYAIVDGTTFRGMHNSDFSVESDPRDATSELGEKTIKRSVGIISKLVRDTWASILSDNSV